MEEYVLLLKIASYKNTFPQEQSTKPHELYRQKQHKSKYFVLFNRNFKTSNFLNKFVSMLQNKQVTIWRWLLYWKT